MKATSDSEEKIPNSLSTPKETFIGDALHPADTSFSAASMSTGAPGLPRTFSWKRKQFSVLEVLEQWKEAGDCRHGSGERYIRKHWFRIRTAEGPEMKIYFERQSRSSSNSNSSSSRKSRWRLYSIKEISPRTCT